MRIGENELLLLHNGNTQIGKMALIYASTFASNIRQIDISDSETPLNILETLTFILKKAPIDFINKTDTFFQKYLTHKEDFTSEELVYLFSSQPNLLKYPIAMYHGAAIICQCATDVFQLMPLEVELAV